MADGVRTQRDGTLDGNISNGRANGDGADDLLVALANRMKRLSVTNPWNWINELSPEDRPIALDKFIITNDDDVDESQAKVDIAKAYGMLSMSVFPSRRFPDDVWPFTVSVGRLEADRVNVIEEEEEEEARQPEGRAQQPAQAQQPAGSGNGAHPLSIASIIRAQRRPRSIFAGAGGFPLRTR